MHKDRGEHITTDDERQPPGLGSAAWHFSCHPSLCSEPCIARCRRYIHSEIVSRYTIADSLLRRTFAYAHDHILLTGRRTKGKPGAPLPHTPTRWMNTPTACTSCAGTASSNSNARMSVKIRAFSLFTRIVLEHFCKRKWNAVIRGREARTR